MSPRGSIMLEVLIAAGVTAMFMSAIVSLVIVSNQTSDRAIEFQTATWSANEGIAALQTLAFTDLTITETGSLSLTGATGNSLRYTLGTSGAQTLGNGMTRTLRVREVKRDASCDIVTSGGTVDVDSKYLVSTVAWTDSAGRNHSTTQEALRTRWDDPQGPCFAPNMAAQIDFNISGAVFSGGKQLRQVYFTNTGGTAAVVSHVQMTWNNGAEFDQLFLDTSKVWSATGPGSPAGSQLTGAVLDIQDFTINPGQTIELNKGQFNINMNGVAMTMTVTFSDGSSWTSPTFYPL